jgi:two-component system alkaline phosphatase synthesis response regulator PhoP
VLYALKQSGLAAEGFSDAATFWRAMARRSPSLILLDIMLPGEDGLSILRRLRQQPETAAIPVMMLTARGAEMEKVMGLNAGADDYLAKPFSILELVARVNALLRRVQPATREAPLEKGGILLDPEKHTVSVRGELVILTLKEFELLYYLMRNPGIACGRDRLLASVWDAAYPGNTRTVDVHVQTLRQKLGSAGDWIETVRGVGYRFRAER